MVFAVLPQAKRYFYFLVVTCVCFLLRGPFKRISDIFNQNFSSRKFILYPKGVSFSLAIFSRVKLTFITGYQYPVHIYTGDKWGAGTDANVLITIFGEEGDSGENKLDGNKNKFESGQ